MINPFTQVYQQIISLLQSCPAITGPYGIGVNTANIIDLTTALRSQAPPVPETTTGRTPQILVLPAGGVMRPYGSDSRVATATRSFLICVTTDTLRVGGEVQASSTNYPVSIFSVEWAIMLAFVSQPNLALASLVKRYDAIFTSERGLLDKFSQLSTTDRWTGILKIDVELYFGSYGLLQYLASITPS